MRRNDRGHLQVLEAMLVTLVLLGAVFAVIQFRLPSTPRENARASIHDVATDALVVLSGLREGDATFLEAALAEAYHCSHDAAASAGSCHGGRGRNLSLKLDSYLPDGAAYMVGIGNGVAMRELWRSSAPMGEAVEARAPLSAGWGFTYVVAELSCQEPATEANVTLIPIHGGAVTPATTVGVREADGLLVAAEPAHEVGLWNATLPATRPDAGTLTADVDARAGAVPGRASHAACDLEGRTGELQAAARETGLVVEGPSGEPRAPVAGQARIRVGSDALAALPDAQIVAREVTVFAPVPPRAGQVDAYAEVARLAVAPTQDEVEWDVPSEALYGAHVVLLTHTLRLTLPSTAVVDVDVRTVRVLEVSLPTGEVPLAPPYAAVLQVWFPDWR